MSLNGHLASHWGKHKEAQAVNDVKARLTNLFGTLNGNVAAVNEIMASDAFEDVDAELVAEMQAIVNIYNTALVDLDAHTEFLMWTPPPQGGGE